MTATVTPEKKNDRSDLLPAAEQLNQAEENDSPVDDDVKHISLYDSLTEEDHNALTHIAPLKSVTETLVKKKVRKEEIAMMQKARVMYQM